MKVIKYWERDENYLFELKVDSTRTKGEIDLAISKLMDAKGIGNYGVVNKTDIGNDEILIEVQAYQEQGWDFWDDDQSGTLPCDGC